MKIGINVATMNQSSNSQLQKAMGISSDYVIINQVTRQDITLEDICTTDKKFISVREVGLSKSRNLALDRSNADICVIADDDMTYIGNYEEVINNAYQKYPDADIIAFVVKNSDKTRSKKTLKEGRIRLLRSLKLQSVQITFKRRSVVNKCIYFNEEFGAGADNYMGEENIFLADCLRSGLKIYYVPIQIASLNLSESTWFRGHNNNHLRVQGAVFYNISAILCLPLILQYIVRKRKLYSAEVHPMRALALLFKGAIEAKNRKRIYYSGDFVSNNGPAIVNKMYKRYIRNDAYTPNSNGKVYRILHFAIKILLSKYVIVSGISKLHLYILGISKLMGKDVSYLMHGYAKIESDINDVNNTQSKIKIERAILAHVDRIICVSEKFSQYMKSEMPELSKKITYVNNGVDALAVRPSEKRKDDYHYTIMTVGGGIPIKNTLQICQAIESLKDYSVKLIVVGPKDKYGDDIAKYPFVTYYESLPHDEVLAMMSSADLYIQNSTFETFGLAVCEAITRGCNLLVSRHVGATDVIEGLDERINIISDTSDIGDIARKIIRARKSTKLPTISSKADWNDAAQRLLRITKKGHL